MPEKLSPPNPPLSDGVIALRPFRAGDAPAITAACQPLLLLSSADWMPRNFFRRIEVGVPIEDGLVRDRLINEILKISLADNVKARLLQPDGQYLPVPRAPSEKPARSQEVFMALSSQSPGPPKTSRARRPPYPRVKLAERPRGDDATAIDQCKAVGESLDLRRLARASSVPAKRSRICVHAPTYVAGLERGVRPIAP